MNDLFRILAPLTKLLFVRRPRMAKFFFTMDGQIDGQMDGQMDGQIFCPVTKMPLHCVQPVCPGTVDLIH